MKGKISNFKRLDYIFYLVIILSFLIRIIDLNYNSAFNDEAIYIVIGKVGLFASDWWSYGAKQWMAGLPYIYPVLTALAYQTKGLFASRLLNVIFGVFLVEEVYRLTKLLNLFDKKTNKIAALSSAFIAGFSGIGIFVSKLATYDMPSFFLLFLGINSFLKASQYEDGKYYFLSFLSLFFSYLTKITTAFFFPILLILSVIQLKKESKWHRKLAILYLYIPFTLATFVYALTYLPNLISYTTSQRGLGLADSYYPIFAEIWSISGVVVALAVPSILILFYKSKFWKTLIFILLAAVIPVSHLLLKRINTLDKHLYLTIIFLSVIVGYAIGIIINKFGNTLGNILKTQSKDAQFTVKAIVCLVTLLLSLTYMNTSYQQSYNLEHQWQNSNDMLEFLRQNVNENDKVLTEDGASVVLALYGKVHLPQNVVTFDWIDYLGITDDTAYLQALDDRYFDFIELDNDYEGKDNLKEGIRERLENYYSLVYKKGIYEVYAKNENK